MPVIKGLQKTTLVDFPGKIAATIFTSGCNFRCVFCHNSALVDDQKAKDLPTISPEEVLEYLRGRTAQLEGVCISGGEPTIHQNLPEFIREIKAMGYAVKLDTNGTNPEMLAKLLAEKLLDYVAMDIKGPLALYSQIVNTEVDPEKITQSIEVVKQSGIKYEFRTTVMPEFHSNEDIEHVACLLRGADAYYLQQFRSSEGVLNPEYQNADSYTDAQLETLAQKYRPFVTKVKVRGVA